MSESSSKAVHIYKEDNGSIHIVIDGIQSNEMDVLVKMLKNVIEIDTGLTQIGGIQDIPLAKKGVNTGYYLYTPNGKIYLNNLYGEPLETDLIIKALRETTSKNDISLKVFNDRLKFLLKEKVLKEPLGDLFIRYEDYFKILLADDLIDNMCNTLDELQKVIPEQEIKEIIMEKL